MFGSLEEFEKSPAFGVFFVIAFPLLFAAIWCFVHALTSRISGWHALAKLYRYADQPVTEWMFRGGGGVYRASLPFAGKRGRLKVGASPEGLVIKSPWIGRPFHPPLFLPFDKIVAEEVKTILSFEFTMIIMQDVPDARVGILSAARQMAEAARPAANGTG